MKISIITLFPKMIEGFFAESIVKRACDRGLVEIELVNLRDFSVDDYGSVDDRPYGGGAGMVLRVETIHNAISKIKNQISKTILTSPRGAIFTQAQAKKYSLLDHLIIVAGHYEGVDERARQLVDEEISLGDFVLTGGEIVASAVVDAVVRLIPSVLKKEMASVAESFFEIPIEQLTGIVGEQPVLTKLRQKGAVSVKLLEYPQYTRPENFRGMKVPQILFSGDHKKIEAWRLKKAFEETLQSRKDLLE